MKRAVLALGGTSPPCGVLGATQTRRKPTTMKPPSKSGPITQYRAWWTTRSRNGAALETCRHRLMTERFPTCTSRSLSRHPRVRRPDGHRVVSEVDFHPQTG